MPRNGFFFLFMAQVTTRAGKGKDGDRGGRQNTTDVRGFAAGRGRAPRVTRAPEAERQVGTKLRPPRIPRAEVPETRLGDFRPRLRDGDAAGA